MSSNIPTIIEFWAKSKPFQSAITHGMVSGKVAQHLYDSYLSEGIRSLVQSRLSLSENETRDFVGYLSSLHDIGKVELEFQRKDDAMLKKLLDSDWKDYLIGAPKHGIRHEKTGKDIAKAIWKARKEPRNARDFCSKIIGAHHQGKGGMGNFSKMKDLFNLQKAFEEQMAKTFLAGQSPSLPEIDDSDEGILGAVLLGIVILADWISSGPVFADAETWIYTDDANNIINIRTQDFLERSSLKPVSTDWGSKFCDVWPNIPENGLRDIQKEVEFLFEKEDDDFDLVLIEAPMGEGKTEAGIYAALQMMKRKKKDGFYVALPTSATANQMVGRIRELLGIHKVESVVRLLHGSAWLSGLSGIEDFTHWSDEVVRWTNPTRRALLAQYGVGTVDQAMLSVMKATYGVIRLIGLVNKVLIVDEIHSYDAYMSSIIETLLSWCKALQIPVVLLSATLPPEKKKTLLTAYTDRPLPEGYPMITAIRADGTVEERAVKKTVKNMSIRVKTVPLLTNPTGIARMAVEAVEDGGCICVLMNTIAEAQEAYQEIARTRDDDLLLFHARFPSDRRDEIEKTCLRLFGKDKSARPKRAILVATQVVEQSLDLDFDKMLIAIAPIDLVLQRLGREFRHDETIRPAHLSSPEVIILVPEEDDFGLSQYVYPECLLRSARMLLTSRAEIKVPEDIPRLVQDGYDSKHAPKEERDLWKEKLETDAMKSVKGGSYAIGSHENGFWALEDDMAYDDSEDSPLVIQTRMSMPSVKIVLLDQEEIDSLGIQIEETPEGKVAIVLSKKTAEAIMRKSVSVQTKKLGSENDDKDYIQGDGLIQNVRLYITQDQICHLNNGKSMWIDHDLGLMIGD